MGHCVYALGISRDLPFIDRQTYPAMTEAIAMMMGDIQKEKIFFKELFRVIFYKSLNKHSKKMKLILLLILK